MRDLHLWRLLQRPSLDAGEIVPLLTALAELPLRESAPYLGLLTPALTHEDASIRAAAVIAHSGATGRLGLQRIVHALHDPDATVRHAAVEALRHSVLGRDWPRFAHALFHPEPDVRLACLAPGKPFPPPLFWKVFLLADPVCRATAEQQLADEMLTADALPSLFDHVRRGVIPADLVRRLVRNLSWNDWLAYLAPLLPRERDMTGSLGDAMSPSWPIDLTRHYRPDRLDDLFLLLWEPDSSDVSDSPHDAFFDLLWSAVFRENVYFGQWLAFTCLGVAVQKGHWPPAAAALVAVLYPPFLHCPWVPLEVRRHAVQGFVRAGSRCPKRPADEVRSYIHSDLCRRDDGLDLAAVAGLLHALDGSPFACLFDWLDLKDIVAAFESDLERSMPLLSLPDPSRGRVRLIRELCLAQGPNRHRLLALLAQAVPADYLDFLDSLDGASACAVFRHLLALEAEPPPAGKSLAFSDNKLRRLARVLASKIAAGQVARFLAVWLERDAPEESALAAAILARLVHDHHTPLLVPAVVALNDASLLRFLEVIPFCAGMSYDAELALARRLRHHDSEPIRAWATARLREHEQTLGALEGVGLPPAAPPAEPVLRLGLCAQLEARAAPAEPSVTTCQALLASHDPAYRVLTQLQRFLADDDVFLTQLDVEMVKHWRGEARLPFLAHAWLYRWDEHLASLLSPEIALPFAERTLAAALRWAMPQTLVVARRLFAAMQALLDHWRWHDPPRFADAWTEALADVLLDALTTDLAEPAARMLADGQARHGGLIFDAIRPRLLAALVGAPEAVRRLFADWIDTRGLAQRPVLTLLTEDDDDIAAELEAALRADDQPTAAAATLQLRRRGAIEGHITAMLNAGLLPAFQRLISAPNTIPEVRYHIAAALHRAGRDLFATLLDAVCADGPTGWFTDDDLDTLRDASPLSPTALYLRLARSPHPAAYTPALSYLLSCEDDLDIRHALLDFLDAGTDRMRQLRLDAAAWLYRHGERASVLPVLLSVEPADPPPYAALFASVPGALVQAATVGLLAAGLGEPTERLLLDLLTHGNRLAAWSPEEDIDPQARQEGLTQLLAGATHGDIRQRARRVLRSGVGRTSKLRRVAETFAWGVRIGRQLTGRLFSLEMIAGEELGYTRLRENKLFITPMPILRNLQHGREVVRGLILHEYGHHLYHKGDEAELVWQRAEQEGMHRLLNLVSDEHLERNLRVRDTGFGDQLKTLGAFAFQHTAREVPVETLLGTLRGQAFAVLSQAHLGVARKPGCVEVRSGRLMNQMERSGVSFARFMRALRMGLGNRHGDPKVARGLALFAGKRFRGSTMEELLTIARHLREIFGDETDLLETFSQDAVLLGDAEDLSDASEGITKEELQSEVRRVMEGPTGPRVRGSTGGRGYNTAANEDFEPLTHIVPKLHDPARHGAYATRVARPAQKMRQYLRELGLGYQPQRMRVRGRSFDRSRVRAVVLRRDPRMLIARQISYQSDLFLGVLIDCSGSMSADENIEKAKLFGTLLAEAARGNRGIDLRLWGFTDRTLYECGDAARPAVHDLEPEDGNNDAAALWHAAQTARASRRRAKLLVMISDGSPTECSIAALRALVQRLSRRMKILCAQVAVAPLEDVCFPHHVLLEEGNLDEAVKRFGVIIARLVRRALSG